MVHLSVKILSDALRTRFACGSFADLLSGTKLLARKLGESRTLFVKKRVHATKKTSTTVAFIDESSTVPVGVSELALAIFV